jgi:cellulose synthase (UDP-forming)
MTRPGKQDSDAYRRAVDPSEILLLVGCLGIMAVAGMLPLTAGQQWVFGGCMVALALWVDVASRSYVITLMMMLLSSFATFRYAVWRYGTLADYLRYPTPDRRPLDIFFMSILALAELYTILVLYLGYFQMAYPLKRKPVAMPEELELWPDVDVLIPTYNEPLELVRYTVLAAMNMDWPPEKLHIFLLDDGRRQQFREFAERAGVEYLARADNEDAKAGNINHALRSTHSPYVAIFDCDHVPVRSFLQFTMGWFFRDKKMALVQTPHHFYSPDPFERNLKQHREVPNEGQLFYGIVQVCNDFWNASFFCGSCAVIRREALDEAGGIATETVREDAHTSLRMQMAGWNTAYLNTPQAAGLATERLSGHVKQRIRWARGMVQILRREKPLLAPELSWAQRLCYFNAMLHFLYALPRLIFLTAPLVYLLFGYKVLPGSWDLILAFAMPHLLLAQITNSRIQGEHRHSFWNEVYEAVLAPYILLPTLLALVSPKSGKFDVTDKGGIVEESYLDMHMARPFFILLFFNLLGLAMVPVRMLYLDRMHPGTALINGLWDMLSIVIIGVVIGVAHESQQRRQSIRIAMRTLAWIVLPDGTSYEGSTVDLSSGGSAIHLDEYLPPSGGMEVQIVLPRPSGSNVSLPARIVGGGGRVVRVQFQELSTAQERKLVGVLFSRANAWLNWADNTTHDSLWRSFALIVKLSGKGLGQAAHSLFSLMFSRPGAARKRSVPAQVSMLIVLAMAGFAALSARAQNSSAPIPASIVNATPAAADTFSTSYSFASMGAVHPIHLKGTAPEHELSFVVPETEMGTQATLHVRYVMSPAMIPALSHINVLLNGTIVASLPMGSAKSSGVNTVANGAAAPVGLPLDQTVGLPAALLVHRNTISFRLIGHYTETACEDPASSAIWAEIDPATSLELTGNRIAIANDLKLLPLPFFDRDSTANPKLSIVFLTQPSKTELEAASVVASWIGVMADYRGANFSVSVGQIPPGDAIVFGTQSAVVPGVSIAQLGLLPVNAPTLAMRTNPGDPFGKLLIVTGANDEQLLKAAWALAINPSALAGDTVKASAELPAPRQADDAPRWLNPSGMIPLYQMQSSSLETDGSAPVKAYLRTAPDLYFGSRGNVRLHLFYRYDPIPLAPRARLTLAMNQAYAGSIPLPAGDHASSNGRETLAIPTGDMAPFANTLRMDFYMPVVKAGLCSSGATQRAHAAILSGSYLDLKGIPHWAALPNLQLFSNAGFPFTRFADLAQTTVILPQNPSPAEMELLLTLVAHMGAETGFPALRLTIGSPDNLAQATDTDILILGSAKDQPAFARLAASLPILPRADGLTIRHAAGMFTPIHNFWSRIQGRPMDESGEVQISGALPDAMLEGAESPYHAGRSVVLVMVKSDAEVTPFLNAFAAETSSSAIARSVSILHGRNFSSYRLGDSLYHVGKLPPWDLLAVELAAYPYLGALGLLFLCFLLALFAQAALRRRAARRLLDREDRANDSNAGQR